MGESLKSLFRRGAISSKTMGKMSKPAILNKTTAQPSKMAAFDGKKKDEGKAHGKGHASYSVDEINEKGVQDKGGRFGTPSKGAQVGKGGQPTVDAINQAQGPKFPAGAKVSSAHGKRVVGIKGHKGKSSGPEYGGPNSRANG